MNYYCGIIFRFSLPNLIANELKKLVPKAIFTTNPCRIQYCTREIVVFRANLVAKFLQGSLYKPPREEIGSCVRKYSHQFLTRVKLLFVGHKNYCRSRSSQSIFVICFNSSLGIWLLSEVISTSRFNCYWRSIWNL